MITRFHATGANAGTPKMRSELRIPVTTPVMPRIATIGNRIRVSVTTRSAETLSWPYSSRCTYSGAVSMNTALTAPRNTAVVHSTMPATRHASRSRPPSCSSRNTGTKAPEMALSATMLRTRLGRLKATLNADIAGPAPNTAAATLSRTRPATRDRAVAAPNAAVDTASRRCSAIAAAVYRRPPSGPLCYHHAAPERGVFRMANSKQQAKRVRIASRQRLENLRYRTQIKTLFRRLDEAVESGDDEAVATAHRRLQGLLDRAASHRAIHRNAASRKKAQAARAVSGERTAA